MGNCFFERLAPTISERLRNLAAALVLFTSSPEMPADGVPEFDPKPAERDFLLPMPNELKMVFRPVYLKVGDDALAERQYEAGDRTGKHDKEALTMVTVNGSFIHPERQDWMYYIGKYEVTRAQFTAVLPNVSAIENPNHGKLPQASVSELEVQKFISEYNRWLRSQPEYSELLPRHQGALGVLRLPEEVEWEFAARGGVEVSSEVFGRTTPYGSNVDSHECFAGQKSRNKVGPIGYLEPNKLGIYDMLGNVSELTQTPYQLQIGKGKMGGTTLRGGNFRTPETDIRSSFRKEFEKLQFDGTETRLETVGFRLVIASPIHTEKNRGELSDLARALAAKKASKTANSEAELPKEVVDLMGEIKKRVQDIENQKMALMPSAAQPARVGQSVRLIRDESMLLLKASFRSGFRGEVFSVLKHDLSEKRLYVSVQNAAGGIMALNIPEDACQFILNDAEAEFAAALKQLANGKLAEATRDFSRGVLSGGKESVHAQLKEGAILLQKALINIASAKNSVAFAEEDAKKKLKNASTAESVVSFNGTRDTARAEKYRAEARASLESANLRVEASQKDLEAAVGKIQSLASEHIRAGGYDIAESLLSCLSAFNLSSNNRRQNGNLSYSGNFRRTAFQRDEDERALNESAGEMRLPPPADTEIPIRVAKANALHGEAALAFQDRKLYESRKICIIGIATMPGHRRLLRLKNDVEHDIKMLERVLSITRFYQEREADVSELAPLMNLASMLCADSAPLKKLLSTSP
jgi:formylglycine-generating enzyme required for sulfatase activity